MNITAGLFICVQLFAQWQHQQAESQRLEREKLQTELQLLKLQINPTLLFSTLDTLRPLIWQQDKQAPETVLKLAHLLRYVLYDSQSVAVSVAREITAIEQFVFLHQIINPVGLEVSLTSRGNLTHQSIAPLSLLPIVENAFDQLPAFRADEPAWVSIDLAVDETRLILKVINHQTDTITDNSKQLADIQKQLYFHYADTHSLVVWQKDLVQVVTLTLSFPTNGQIPIPLSMQRIGGTS